MEDRGAGKEDRGQEWKTEGQERKTEGQEWKTEGRNGRQRGRNGRQRAGMEDRGQEWKTEGQEWNRMRVIRRWRYIFNDTIKSVFEGQVGRLMGRKTYKMVPNVMLLPNVCKHCFDKLESCATFQWRWDLTLLRCWRPSQPTRPYPWDYGLTWVTTNARSSHIPTSKLCLVLLSNMNL